mmetsp:Transcript_49108/g.117008  ORF Transcript_49108/g.117008 Transcript_49108/m.117008 type:complete len:244 (+) Transcript_49108:622-1353(+)
MAQPDVQCSQQLRQQVRCNCGVVLTAAKLWPGCDCILLDRLGRKTIDERGAIFAGYGPFRALPSRDLSWHCECVLYTPRGVVRQGSFHRGRRGKGTRNVQSCWSDGCLADRAFAILLPAYCSHGHAHHRHESYWKCCTSADSGCHGRRDRDIANHWLHLWYAASCPGAPSAEDGDCCQQVGAGISESQGLQRAAHHKSFREQRPLRSAPHQQPWRLSLRTLDFPMSVALNAFTALNPDAANPA